MIIKKIMNPRHLYKSSMLFGVFYLLCKGFNIIYIMIDSLQKEIYLTWDILSYTLTYKRSGGRGGAAAG